MIENRSSSIDPRTLTPNNPTLNLPIIAKTNNLFILSKAATINRTITTIKTTTTINRAITTIKTTTTTTINRTITTIRKYLSLNSSNCKDYRTCK